MQLTRVVIVIHLVRLVGERADRSVVLMVAVRVRGHRRIVHRRVVCGVLGLVVVVVVRGVRCRVGARRNTSAHGRSVVDVVVDGEVWKRRLRKGLRDELALLVLEVREVASSFFLGKSSGLCKTLLVPALDDLRDTLQSSEKVLTGFRA